MGDWVGQVVNSQNLMISSWVRSTVFLFERHSAGGPCYLDRRP